MSSRSRLAYDKRYDIRQSIMYRCAIGSVVIAKWSRFGEQLERSTPDRADDIYKQEISRFHLDDRDLFRRDSELDLDEYFRSRQKDTFWSGVKQGLVASLIYSLLIAAIVFVIRLTGNDILDLMQDLLSD